MKADSPRELAITLDQLVRPEPGGIGTYAHGLLAGLAELRAGGEFSGDVVGVVPGRRWGAAREWPVPVSVTGLGARATTTLWRWRPLGVPRSAAVVHATTMAGPFTGGRDGAVHSVLVHDLLWREHGELTTPRGARFHEQRLRQIARGRDRRVLVTSAQLRDAVVAAGVGAERVHVVRLGVNATPTSSGASPIDGPFTLCVGTIQPRKNLARLARAHRVAAATNPELGPLVLVGRRAWGDVDTGGAVELGPVPDTALAPILAAARVVAYVPVAEGWGFPAVEALAAGRPTVAATTVPSVRENVEVDRVDPLSEDDISRGLLAALARADTDDDQRRRRASVADLTWAQCARDHLAAWS